MGNPLETQREPTLVTVNGFTVKPSHVKLANWIFESHPKTTEKVQLQNQELKTTCMNLLFSIIQTLYHKPDPSETELSKASKDLSDLTQVGFKLDWLKSEHKKVSLERKKHHASKSRIVELEEKANKLELMMSDLKVELEKEKAKFN